MRIAALSVLVASSLCAQSSPGAPVLKGVVLERDQGVTGEFSVRAADFHVHRFRYDSSTVVRRQDANTDVPRLRPGDEVEVVCDTLTDTVLGYALSVNVTLAVAPPSARRPAKPTFLRPYPEQEDRMLPRGDLSLSGVILRVDGDRLVLRTRTGDQRTVLLRKDTRYLENGEMVALASLKPTMRVYVRAGKNLYGDVEGYQVAWGHILEVH